MKRWIFALIAVMLLGLTSCAAAPEPTAPVYAYDLAYDMGSYDFFSDIFLEKSLEEWTAMGRYTILLEGLHTPVLVDLNGMDVLAVHAYGQTAELGEAGLADEYHDGFSPVYDIRSTREVVVIRISGGESSDDSILITGDRHYTFQPENGSHTSFSVGEDGTLRYFRSWDAMADFEQMGCEALASCTSRDEPLYEMGHAEIAEGDLVLTPEETVVLSEVYDLDAMFAEAKDFGMFEGYETVDALLAANLARAGES